MTLRPPHPRAWLRLPRRTIRLRLTLLYGALFLVSGAALLTATYLLVKHQYTQNGASLFVARAFGSGNVKLVGPVPAVTQGGLAKVLQTSGTAVTVGPAGGAASGAAARAPAGFPAPTRQVKLEAQARSSAALHQLLVNSGIALALMAVLSVWLGWLVAGRALRPLRTITNAARDISASSLHRRLALAGPDDEIKQLGNTFDELLERLEASFEAQRQFVANASHELRTPLTFGRTLVEVALADPDADLESLRHMGEQVLAAGEHQERLIEALLTLSRGQRGLERHEPVDLAATTAQVVDAITPGSLTIATKLEPVSTTGDPRLVERLVTNLVANAVRHNVERGRVEISTRTRAGHALLTVDNTGPTVPSNQVDRLFEPFQRLEGERASGSDGLGLGLSIVRAVAAAHGAALTARPRPGGGLHVEVAFPGSRRPAPRSPVLAASANGR